MAKVDVTMPKMGESITEGTVIVWHKQPGEMVELDEVLLEIGTDKVDTEVPSPAAGVVQEILVPEGETVEVGTKIAVIETETEAGGDAQPAAGPPAEAAPAEAPEAEAEPEPAEAPEAEAEPAMAAGAEAAAEKQTATRASAAEEEAAPSPAGGEGVVVTMPKMGESITEGTVIVWHKQPGEMVELDEVLLEIGTDKVDTEVPSPAAGVVQEILVPEGETVEVGTPLARIAAEAEAGAETPKQPAPQEAAPAQATVAQAASGDGAMPEAPEVPVEGASIDRHGADGRFYSPLVRSIAEKEGLSMQDLEAISGSGRGGRLTKQDVLEYVEAQKQRGPAQAPQAAPAQKAAPAAKAASAQKAAPSAKAATTGTGQYEGRVEIVEMDRMRQIIAEHMVRSKATSAHVTSFAEVDVTNLVRLRGRNKHAFEQREGIKLSLTPFLVRGAVEALREHPVLNASVDGTRIVLKKDFHIGIAVAIDQTRLVVPVIRDAGQRNLAGLAKAANDLADRARSKRLQPEDLQGGTFTVTNIGSIGSLMGTPIINQPQVAILATGAIKKRPVVVETPDMGDVIAIRHMMYISLSYDHRVIDGAMASSFLRQYTRLIESLDPNGNV